MTGALPSPAVASGRDGSGAPLHVTDVVVLGAGVAGLVAAANLASSVRVLVVDKGRAGTGSSPWAQGGVAVAVGPDDDPTRHAEDTIRAGAGLSDPIAVETLVAEGPARIEDLVRWGARFDDEPDGRLHVAREAGQSVARSVHRADATGAEMVRVLRSQVAPRVTRLVGTAVVLTRDLDARIEGCWVLDPEGELHRVVARAVLLATGGCGALYEATTNRTGATGDGLSLAWEAGAALRDLEFVQFHPTGLAGGSGDALTPRLLLTEALRGAGATLHADDGSRLMDGIHPALELAPRDVVTTAIVEAGGRAWLDARHLGTEQLERSFPTVLTGARERGFDLAEERVPVEPVAHYQIGGVRTDLGGRTSLEGLWAAGEVASTGVHGANRMAGNSLLEALVFGARSGAGITAALAAGPPPGATAGSPAPRPTVGRGTAPDVGPLMHRLRAAMMRGCGPLRSAEALAETASTIRELAAEIGDPTTDAAHVEITHGVRAAGLLVRAAALRGETRGCHVRRDHPGRSAAWEDVRLELTRH